MSTTTPPNDSGDCARNYGGQPLPSGACDTCGFVHCGTCKGTRIVADSGDVEFDTCSACRDGAALCGCGEPATLRHLGQSDGEPVCQACAEEDETARIPVPADPGRTVRLAVPGESMRSLVFGSEVA